MKASDNFSFMHIPIYSLLIVSLFTGSYILASDSEAYEEVPWRRIPRTQSVADLPTIVPLSEEVPSDEEEMHPFSRVVSAPNFCKQLIQKSPKIRKIKQGERQLVERYPHERYVAYVMSLALRRSSQDIR